MRAMCTGAGAGKPVLRDVCCSARMSCHVRNVAMWRSTASAMVSRCATFQVIMSRPTVCPYRREAAIWLKPGTPKLEAEQLVKTRLCAGVVGRCLDVTMDGGQPATVYDIQQERELKALCVRWRPGADGVMVVDGHEFEVFGDGGDP